MPLRWYFDLALAGLVVVGRVYQLPAGPDPIAPGQVQKQAPWQAYGMRYLWQDYELGQHESREAAKVAIVKWHTDLIVAESRKLKLACSVHFQYRAGCVMCEAVNMERKIS